mgnify:CR=1 FL=1
MDDSIYFTVTASLHSDTPITCTPCAKDEPGEHWLNLGRGSIGILVYEKETLPRLIATLQASQDLAECAETEVTS